MPKETQPGSQETKKKTRAYAFAMIAGLSMTGPAAAATLLTNGSFETATSPDEPRPHSPALRVR